MTRLQFAIISSAALILGCGRTETFEGLPVEPVDKPVLLRHKLDPGATWSGSISSSIGESTSRSITLSGRIEGKCVTKTTDRARYRVEFRGDVRVNGTGHPQAFVIESLKDLRGNVISETIDGLPIDAEGRAYVSDLILPENPVKSGDTWESKITAAPINAKITYRFVGRVLYKQTDAYAIEGSVNPGELWTDDPGYRFIVDAKTLRTLRLIGGLKSDDGFTSRFNVESDP